MNTSDISPGARRTFYGQLTPDNAAVLLVDHQVGLCSGVVDLDVLTLKHNVVALAKAARVLGVPTIVTATAPESMWGLASGTFSLTKREMGLLRLANLCREHEAGLDRVGECSAGEIYLTRKPSQPLDCP